MKTLTEFIVKQHQKRYKYQPQTKDELTENIKAELDDGNYDLNCIDTSKITDMSFLFGQYKGIKLTIEQQENLDISQWNVSNVMTMKYMFIECQDFNGDLSLWDVSKVTNMCGMFNNCKSFNQNLSRWDTSNVKSMEKMFQECKSFNQDLSQWDTSNVEDMAFMFFECDNFNQDLSRWDVSNVRDMSYMFYDCPALKNKPSWYKG